MDKSTVFSRLQAQKSDHLEPLSLHSRVISYDSKNIEPTTSPFINFKIEILDGSKKRKLKDIDADETSEVPATKTICLKALSPDQGCFVDFSSSPGTRDSSVLSSSPVFLDIKSGTGNGAESPNHELCFDNEIDSILSLNPLSTAVHKEEEGQVEGKDEDYFSLSYVRGPVLGGLSSTDEVIEGWNIGSPLLESSVCVDELVIKDQIEVLEPNCECQATLSRNDPQETSYEASVPLQVKVKSVVLAVGNGKPTQHHDCECQATLDRNDSQETSYEASLPLQVKVKSAVVAVHNSKPTQHPDPEQSRRPDVFRNGEDWEREKRIYVHSVTRHINENPAAGQDAMSELQSLMMHVAGEMRNSRDNRWQHPTDLTQRNYQQRFGNTIPTLSLREWKARNDGYKRFASVRHIFERSPFP